MLTPRTVCRCRFPWIVACAVVLASVSGCPNTEIMLLRGEGPEVAQLLEKRPLQTPKTSALTAARALHQALVQANTEEVWSLLAAPTRRALDERATTIGTTGRDLLDTSTLPNKSGTVIKVRFESVFFGKDLAELKTGPDAEPADDRRIFYAVSGKDATTTKVELMREEEGWKLLKTDL